MEFDGLMPWLCPARFCVAGKGPVFCAGVAACLPSLVPRTRTSPRRRAPSRPLGLEHRSIACGRSRRCIACGLRGNRPRSETPILLVPAHRRHRIRTASFVSNRRVATARKHTPFARHHHATPTQVASHGIASFYTEDQQTASGEKFDTHELTAAHRTLPFGTRLRVTNVATGRSVTVRVNDRGPYIPGRVVDVSGSAANELGIVDRGIAKVRVDVVQ